METRMTMWDSFSKRGLSRRTFLKTCTALTAMMGLPLTDRKKVVEAATKQPLPVVVWLHGHECTGCDEAFIRSQSPLASDLVLNMISLEYSDTLAAAAGEPFEKHLETVIKKYDGKFILAVEGGVPLADQGISCMVGGKPFVDVLKEVAKHAAAIIEYGSCAAWGGVQAAKPNPTGSVSVSKVISGKPIIKVPGCPPIPEVMTGVVMHLALFGQIPPLDAQGRPKQFYGNRIHDTCYRRSFFDAGMFAERFDDAGSKAGWCLYKLGCRGPEAYNACGNLRWWNGLSYPIQSGSPCFACGSDGFWDNGPFHERLPNVVLPNTLTNADKIGAGLTVAAMAGVTVHAVISSVQKSRHAKNESEHDEK